MVKARLEKHMPEILPIAGKRLYISYPGQLRQCRKCFEQGHASVSCTKSKVDWLDYVLLLMNSGNFRKELFEGWKPALDLYRPDPQGDLRNVINFNKQNQAPTPTPAAPAGQPNQPNQPNQPTVKPWGNQSPWQNPNPWQNQGQGPWQNQGNTGNQGSGPWQNSNNSGNQGWQNQGWQNQGWQNQGWTRGRGRGRGRGRISTQRNFGPNF